MMVASIANRYCRKMKTMTSGIYAIRNIVNDKQYIGSATNLSKRWGEHRHYLKRGRHHSSALQNAWSKYGADAFQFRVLLYCTRQHLLEFEQRCIDGLPSEYNICIVAGSNSRRGLTNSAEHRAKITAAKLGKKRSPEARANMAAAQRGKKRSPEAVAKMIAGLRGRKQPPEAVARTAAANRGRKRSPEAIAKTAAANRGRKLSPEHVAKVAAALRGRKRSPDVGAKVSAAKRGMRFSAEHRAKLSAAAKQRGLKRRADTTR